MTIRVFITTKMFRRSQLLGAALFALLGIAACSESPQEAAPDLSLDLVAQVAADGAIDDLSYMNASHPADAGLPGPDGQAPNGRRRPAARDVTFFDENGARMEAYDSLLTASLAWSHTRTVEFSRGTTTGSSSRSRSMTVSGLLGIETERTHNGTGEESVSRVQVSDDAGTRSYAMQSTTSVDEVVHAVDREANPWPLSGSITRVMSVQVVNGPNGDANRSRSSTITFNGTQFATMVVDGETFEVDLAARQGQRAAQQGPRRGR